MTDNSDKYCDVDVYDCKPNIVYNVYSCKKCVIEHDIDKILRKKRKWAFFKEKNKKYTTFGCNCEKPTKFLIKFKRCLCGDETWGLNLRNTNKCKKCYPKKKFKPKYYYRLKIFRYKSKKNLNDPERGNCKNRRYCLEVVFKRGANKGIACKNCNFYESLGF